MLSGWDFFKTHKALDFHFHYEQYDVIKYKGKINTSPEKFGQRNDRYRFEYFGGKFFNREKAAQFCIGNFIRGNRDFIYQSYEDAEGEFLQWKKIQESISKVFSDDLKKIIERAKGVDVFNVTPSGNLPPLLQMLKVSFVTKETAVILHREREEYLTKWNGLAYNDPYAEMLILQCRKYVPFVVYNKDKIQSILKELKV